MFDRYTYKRLMMLFLSSKYEKKFEVKMENQSLENKQSLRFTFY